MSSAPNANGTSSDSTSPEATAPPPAAPNMGLVVLLTSVVCFLAGGVFVFFCHNHLGGTQTESKAPPSAGGKSKKSTANSQEADSPEEEERNGPKPNQPKPKPPNQPNQASQPNQESSGPESGSEDLSLNPNLKAMPHASTRVWPTWQEGCEYALQKCGDGTTESKGLTDEWLKPAEFIQRRILVFERFEAEGSDAGNGNLKQEPFPYNPSGDKDELNKDPRAVNLRKFIGPVDLMSYLSCGKPQHVPASELSECKIALGKYTWPKTFHNKEKPEHPEPPPPDQDVGEITDLKGKGELYVLLHSVLNKMRKGVLEAGKSLSAKETNAESAEAMKQVGRELSSTLLTADEKLVNKCVKHMENYAHSSFSSSFFDLSYAPMKKVLKKLKEDYGIGK